MNPKQTKNTPINKIFIEPLSTFNKDNNLNAYQLNMNYVDNLGTGSKIFKISPVVNFLMKNNIKDVIIAGDINSTSCFSFLEYTKDLSIKVHFVCTFDTDSDDLNKFNIFTNLKIYKVGKWSQSKVSDTINEIKNAYPLAEIIGYGISHPASVEGIFQIITKIKNFEKEEHINFDTIILSAGSGGLLTGFSIFKNIHSEKWDIVGVSVYNRMNYFKEMLNRFYEWYNIHKNTNFLATINFKIECHRAKTLYGKNQNLKLVKYLNSINILADRIYVARCFKYVLSKKKEYGDKKILIINSYGIKSKK